MISTRNPAVFSLIAAALFALPNLAHADAELKNLALNKVATASASEDAHPAQDAVDGDTDTRWCNSDASTDSWWQVDLKDPHTLGGCEILWEHENTVYKYVIEGSADGKTWTVLNDQRGSLASTQTQKLALTAKDPVRYLRIKVTGLEDNSWASFFEVKIFDAESIKALSPEAAKAFMASAPEKSAATAPATAPN